MRYVDEFRDIKLIKRISGELKKSAPSYPVNIMEVCGTHTQSFLRFGLEEFIPSNLKLISGPGCPVCVTSQGYIDNAVKLSRDKDNIILTFGDMLRVPGTDSSLEKERAGRGNVKVAYSPLDSLLYARGNPKTKIIFLAAGFETTAPTIALSLIRAKEEKINNLFFYSSLKLITPAMKELLKDKRLNLSGFLCPGHVSCVIGSSPYGFIPREYGVWCCIAGFEPIDILEGLYFLILQAVKNKPRVQNQYARVVAPRGNLKAKEAISKVFEVSAACWRGLGDIEKSGLNIKGRFSRFDALKEFSIKEQAPAVNKRIPRCRCADILKGLISPQECPLFRKVCKPEHPVGPCMVSNEGACNAYYKYK